MRSHTMAWSVTEHDHGPRAIRLDLAGELRGMAVEQLRLKVVRTIADNQPDELSLNLNAVTSLDPAGAVALISGYLAAIDHGTRYRVADAHGGPSRLGRHRDPGGPGRQRRPRLLAPGRVQVAAPRVSRCRQPGATRGHCGE
jgi:anti-anti-sigma regulatory factor